MSGLFVPNGPKKWAWRVLEPDGYCIEHDDEPIKLSMAGEVASLFTEPEPFVDTGEGLLIVEAAPRAEQLILF